LLFTLERINKALEDFTVVLIGDGAGGVLESAGDAEFYAGWLPLAHIAFAADLMLMIEMNIAKGASQAAHLTPHAPLAVDFDRARRRVPLDRSRGAHFKAPGIITLQARHGQTYVYLVIILNADVGPVPVEILGLAEDAGIFTVAAHDAFGNVHGNVIHGLFFQSTLFMECRMMFCQVLRCNGF
jgi:hypothetical protein